MAEAFSAESRLIHAGTERTPGQPGTPPLVPASIYAGHLAGYPRVAAVHYPDIDKSTSELASVEPATDLITDIDQALEVL